MRWNVLLLCALLMIPCRLYAQTGRQVQGVVQILDANRQVVGPAANTVVTLLENGVSDVTNSDGKFFISLQDKYGPGKSITFQVERPGYVIHEPSGGRDRVPDDLGELIFIRLIPAERFEDTKEEDGDDNGDDNENGNEDVDVVILVFPVVVDAIAEGKFEEVPDDQLFRTYIVSLYKGIYDICEPNGSGIGIPAALYGIPQFREMLDNPQDMVWEYFRNLLDFYETGSILNLDNSDNAISFYKEGVNDGRALVQQYTCTSMKVRVLYRRLKELFDRRQNVAPEPNDPERWQALMHPEWRGSLPPPKPKVTRDDLLAACLEQVQGLTLKSDREAWCTCTVRAVRAVGVPEYLLHEMLADWRWALDAARQQNQRLDQQVNMCAI